MPIRLVVLLFSFALTGAGTAQAQSDPSLPIKVVVPFAAGGPQDGIIRMLSQKAAAGLGQSFVIENKAGAGALIAADQEAKAPADGHVLLMASGGRGSVGGGVRPDLRYDPQKDLVAIVKLVDTPMVLVVPDAM